MGLNLQFDDTNGPFMLPRHLFACESLKELELDMFYDLRLPSFVHFPNLTTLTLTRVTFLDDNSVGKLFNGLPNLQNLALLACGWGNVVAVNISAPMLEQLTIYEYLATEETIPECQFMISGSRLKVFDYIGELVNDYCIFDVPLLVDVDVHLSVDIHKSNEARRLAAYRAHKLVRGLTGVKNLYVLSSRSFQVLADAEELIACFPLFHKLNHLEVSWSPPVDFASKALLKLLHKSPYLESITIEPRIQLSTLSERDDWEFDPVPPCFLTHLRRVKVKMFCGYADEVHVLKAILKSAKVLERIDLGTGKDCRRPPLSSSRFQSAAVKKRLRKVHCEFEPPKVNGALFPDSDSRALDRQKALDAAMNDINSSFGKGSVTRLGSAGGALVETFPSGCLTLDLALGGGLPRGRIVEVYGPESSGKTTLALHAIAEVQKLGGNAMLVDAEHAFDPAYSKALGVDVENLIVCQPDNGEMALEIADRMCRSGAIDLICVDSVSALTPRAEIEGEIGMQQMGLQARLMSQALRKMSGNASKAGCTLIFLNQIRYKIGVYYGNPEVTSGGIALKFFASVRLEIRSTGKIKSVKGDEDIGLRVRVRVQKSKVSRPYKQAEFEIIFGEGVSKLGCILDCAEMMDVVVKKGSWYSYGDHRLGQGRDKALQYLRDNPVLCDEIEKIVRSMLTDGTLHLSSTPVKSLSLPPQDENFYEEI
ncbi:hypothetical protein CCACVL1_21375 [Corchorus capsularis]|uniref:Uncharacterized protein n=1 Tax=Corchorus capsularis TaxID=210143 RepID=A0A1R3H670_COCAP|nr:hypothetical protein CCACVL1_21375 [Corchorus capsularis]